MAAHENQKILWKDRKHIMWFPWSFTKYYIQNDRLMLESGLFHTTLDETLLYRIVDITMHQSLAGKLFNTGDIIIKSKADSTPESRRSRNVVGREFYESSHIHQDLDGDGICDEEEL